MIETVTVRPAERPEMDADFKDMRIQTRTAWIYMAQANEPAQIFKYGGMLSRVQNMGDTAKIEPLQTKILRYELAESIDFQGQSGKRREPALPPVPLVECMLSTPQSEIPLPELKGITFCSVFNKDKKLENTPGYLKGSMRYFVGDPVKNIPEILTDKIIEDAKKQILYPFQDFPVKDEADLHNAIAFMITPFVKPLIDDNIPAPCFDAPSHGTGKGKFAQVVFSPGMGNHVKITPLPKDEDEERKKITALTIEGCPGVTFDNINRALDSANFAALLTTRTWSDRILGQSSMVTLPNDMIIAFTGNNLTLSGEMGRRCVWARLIPTTDKPWLRDNFKIENLTEWLELNRENMQRACIILIQSWINAGSPKPQKIKPLGSFEKWSMIVGGILEHAGFNKFLGNQLEFYEETDSESAIWRNFCNEWYEQYQGDPVKVSDLWNIANECDLVFHGKTEDGKKTAFGRQLVKQKDRIYESFQIKAAGLHKKKQCWKLIKAGQEVTNGTLNF